MIGGLGEGVRREKGKKRGEKGRKEEKGNRREREREGVLPGFGIRIRGLESSGIT